MQTQLNAWTQLQVVPIPEEEIEEMEAGEASARRPGRGR